MLETLPVFVISGLLESGKTTFIKDTIMSDDFFEKGKTLILSGEEGEVEYEKEFLENVDVYVNDEVDRRRGRKIYPGDEVIINRQVYKIIER